MKYIYFSFLSCLTGIIAGNPAFANSIEIPKDLRLVSIIKSAQVIGYEFFCESSETCKTDSMKKLVHLRFPLKSCANYLGPVSVLWSSVSPSAVEMTLYVSAVEYETERALTAHCAEATTSDIMIITPSRLVEKVNLKVLQ